MSTQLVHKMRRIVGFCNYSCSLPWFEAHRASFSHPDVGAVLSGPAALK